MKKYKEIKASDELPGVGIYNCLYNGDHCIFQVHDGGFRIINYHGEKEDAPKLNLVKWLKEDEQDEAWVPVVGNNFPFDVSIIVEHKYGYDAVRLDNHGWKFWYTGELVPEEILTTIIKTAKRYLIGNNSKPPPATKD